MTSNVNRGHQVARHRRSALTLATVAALAGIMSGPLGVMSQEAAPGLAPTTAPAADVAAVPATVPSTMPTTRPNGRPTTARGVVEQGGGLVLNFQDASIDVVLDELSAAAGFIVVKEVKPEGRVSLVSRQPLSADDAVSLLNTVLRNAGYTAIQQERILKIVASDRAKRLNIPVRTGNDPDKIAATDELITQVVPLRFANATQLKTDLQPLVNADADFASNQSSNALVITDTSANVRRVVQIVKALDTSLADAVDVRVVQLKYANATTAATLINNVFGNLDAARASGQEGGAPGQPGNQPGGGGGGGGFRRMMQQMQQQQQNQNQTRSGSKVSAGADERTNSVVISGPPDSLDAVANVLKELDANPAAEETVFVYRLLNAQAVNVESVLNSLFNGTSAPQRTIKSNAEILREARSSRAANGTFGTGITSAQNRTTGGGAFGFAGGFAQTGFGGRVGFGAQQAASDLAGKVSLIADVDSNSLIIRTSPSNYERVKKILDEIDKSVPQVLIKVLVAEVTHDKGKDIGAELSVLNVRALNPDGSISAGQGLGSNFSIPTDTINGTGLVLQVMETNFQAAIRALETAGKLEVLSRPYILASDNQLASITVGQEVPRIDTSIVSTDSQSTTTTVEYQDIGILLDVIPHINPDGLVILDVAPEISALTGTNLQISETLSQPIIAKRSAQSRVSVRNGQTIVIGGLMEDRKTQTLDKVPILGDIPGIGALFRRTRNTKTKTELLIFLTPHVASNPDVLKGMGKNEEDGAQLVPGAVGPGMFKEHKEGLQRGRTAPPDPDDAATTRPTEPAPE